MFKFFSYKRLYALIKKEFLQIKRDLSSLMISFLLPLVLLFIYGFGVSLDLNHLKIGLSVEDSSPLAKSFTETLVHSPLLEIVIGNREELVTYLTEGKIRGFVIIPSYFSTFQKKGTQLAPIQIISDGSEPNTANFVQNYIQGLMQTFLKEQSFTKLSNFSAFVTLETRFWYNPELISRNFLIPGSLALIVTLIGTLLTSLVIAREWERGTMEMLLATSITKSELILSKLIPYLFLGILSIIMCICVATFFYKVPLRGSLLLLSLVSLAFLVSSLGLGILISTFARSQFVAAQSSQISAFLPAFMLSGFIFEISSMPLAIQIVTYMLPARYFVSSLQTLFLAGDVYPLILYDLIPIVLSAISFFLIAVIVSKKRLD